MSQCFVLGAGFSKECGLPLARKLTPLVFEQAYGSAEGAGAEVGKSYLEFMRHLYPALDFSSEWPDFEELITVLAESSEWQNRYEGRDCSGDVPTAGHLKRTMLKELEILICERMSQASPQSMALVEEFVRQRFEAGDHLISFNWDTLIEIASENLGIGVSYSSDGDGLHLSKPHGSVNLAESDSSEYRKLQGSLNVHSLDIEWRDEHRVVVRAHDPADAMFRVVVPFEKTTLIEPTVRKQYQSPWINTQWSSAYKMMRQASDIFVIGFSLPPTDYRPRLLFQIATLKRDPLPRMHIVDPAANDLVDRYKEAVKVEIEPIAQPWSDWIEAAE